jgi:hypothetical protein
LSNLPQAEFFSILNGIPGSAARPVGGRAIPDGATAGD